MNDSSQKALTIARDFAVATRLEHIEPLGNGHIHETWLLRGKRGTPGPGFVLQRMNTGIFRNPDAVMANIVRVTRHIRSKQADGAACLNPIPTNAGAYLLTEEGGAVWRMFDMIEDSVAYDIAPDAETAQRGAAAFGLFQALLLDLPAPALLEPMPHFHDTAARFAHFMDAVERDPLRRAVEVKDEIAALKRRVHLSRTLEDPRRSGAIPARVVHNDTKLNNVLFHATTGKAICVIDLDTVMPGLSLHDFGDLVRSAGTHAGEDETDLSRVELDPALFEALARGYLSATGAFLNAQEVALMHLAGNVITYEVALRFLTDYLTGDTYFRIHHPNHNLERCRTQLKLVESMERNERRMQDIVQQAASGTRG